MGEYRYEKQEQSVQQSGLARSVGLSEENYSNSAMMAALGADTPSDPGLDRAMSARLASRLDGSSLRPSAGRPLTLPDEVKSSVEQHFGHTVDNLQFRESSDVTGLGARAYAQGNVIHFAPGQFRPDTAMGRKMLGHELAHVEQQARGGLGSGGQVLLDTAMERAADRHGEALAAGMGGSFAPTSALTPMPTAPVSAAPVQGWGIDVLGREGRGQHETLTEEARKKVLRAGDRYRDVGGDKAKASLRYGSRFNDVGSHSAIGMAIQMELLKKDAFINQTHHGDMQFLHSMDTSAGDTAANVEKTRRYAQFASDTFQNRVGADGRRFQDQNMLDYVLSQSGPGDPFQEMMLSTMMDPAALAKFDKKFRKRNGLAKDAALDGRMRQRRTHQLREMLSVDEDAVREQAGADYDRKGWLGRFFSGSRDSYLDKKVAKARKKAAGLRSKYAKGTVGDFFTGGSKELDAGYVALGSASHMLEDSFAGSHSIRSDNLHLGGNASTPLSDTGAELVSKVTPILSNADYNQQSNNPLWGRHGKADVFEEGGIDTEDTLERTQGGAMARDAAAQFIKMNLDMKQTDGGYEGSALRGFVRGILREDENARALRMQGNGPTRTGRAYEKDVGLFSRLGESRSVRGAMKQYRKQTGANLVGNKRTTAETRVAQLDREVPMLAEIMRNGTGRAREQFRHHVGETIVNIQSMLRQLDAAPGAADVETKERLRLHIEQLRALLQEQ